jgi:uncharacterized membrane protein
MRDYRIMLQPKSKLRRALRTAIRIAFPARPERFFLQWFLVISVLLCFILPPFMGPDEASHVYRTYEFSKGDVLMDKLGDGYGYKIPDSIVHLNQDQFWSNAHQPYTTALKHNLHSTSVNDSHTTVQYFEATSVYSPIGYLHFIVVTWFSRLFSLSAYSNIILMRLANIALYAAFAYCAIRIMPKRRWFLVMVALMPMAIHQASVVSPDAMINGSALLTVAMIARLLVTRRFPGYKYLSVLAAASLLVAFNKQAYLFFPLILLIIPWQAFGRPIGKRLYIAATFLAVFVCLGVWTLVSSSNSTAAFSQWRQRESFGQTRTTTEFVKYVATEPIDASRFLLHTYVYNTAPKTQIDSALQPEFYVHNRSADFTWESMLGAFGSLMVNYPIWVYFVVVGGLVVPLLTEDYTFVASRRLRWLAGGVIALQFLILTAVLWVKWTAKTDTAIVGVQGRYLLPLVGLIVFLPSAKYMSLNLRENLLPKLLNCAVFIEGAAMLVVIASRFYT